MTAPIKAYATGDIHSPKYLGLFKQSLEKRCRESQPDIFLFTGDYVLKGRAEFMTYVAGLLERCGSTLMVGVFGNEDYEESRDKIRKAAPMIRFLEDQELELDVRGVRIEILGSTGILDEPTRWQSRNIPGITSLYEKRLKMLEEFALRRKDKGVVRIYLSHYPPTYKTLHGEPRFAWPQMGSSKAESILRRTGTIDFAVHGHSHKSRIPQATVGSTLIVNSSLPSIREIAEIPMYGFKGLLRFI